MISVLFDFLFVFNMPVADAVSKQIKRQLDTLQNLYLTDFEVILLKSNPGARKIKLYEDPVIELLCPGEINDEDIQTAMLSKGIMQGLNLDYDPLRSRFVVDKTIDEIIAMFAGFETLLFLEIPSV